MKFEQVNAWKMAGWVAASLALGAVATAQTAGGEAGQFTKRGIELRRVSLEGDIRTAEPARRKIVLQRPAGRELELVFKLHPMRNSAPGALIPALEDMESSLVLQNGTPGAVAVIHLESRAPELRRASGTRIVGFFDEDGKFEGQLPGGFKVRGIFARGEEVTSLDLVKKGVGGHAVPASRRPVMEEVDLEELIDETYLSWLDWVMTYTNLEFRGGHAQRGTTVENDLGNGLENAGGEVLYVEPPSPAGGRRALEKIPLQRPPETLPSPPTGLQGGLRAGEKIPLQRPRKPVQGGGQTKPGTDVDKDLTSGSDDGEVYVEPASPTGGRRAGKKIDLHRPPTQRDDKVLQRRL